MSSSPQLSPTNKILFQNIANGTSHVFQKALDYNEINTIKLNADFGDFNVIQNDTTHLLTATQTVLGKEEVTIQLKDLPRYTNVLHEAIQQSITLRNFEKRINNINNILVDHVNKVKIVYRGITMAELIAIAHNGGIMGTHNRANYAAKTNFVSCSVDKDVANNYAKFIKNDDITIEINITELNLTDYAPVKYKLMQDVYVFDLYNNRTYRPFEEFEDGSFTSHAAHLAEIHLKEYTRPIIRRISFPFTEFSLESTQAIMKSIGILESIYNKPIMIENKDVI